MKAEIRELIEDLDARLRSEEEASRRDLRLPFNGTLSPDEQRMLEQSAFEEYAT